MRIILIGFGTVGRSFARAIQESRSRLLTLFGLRPRLVAVVDRGGAAINTRGLSVERVYRAKITDGSVSSDECYGKPGVTSLEVIRKLEADVVVEATPTNIVDGQPGLSYIEEALKNKRHVITVNKGPLALALPALTELACYNNVFLRFSGTVGGGIPMLSLAKRCLLGDRISSIRGVLNGTTNYVLTRMTEAHVSMDEALKEAQAAGYAEADPSNDLEGVDSACKLVILANWVMNRSMTLDDVTAHGIVDISLKDIEKVEEKGCVYKLIASTDGEDAEVKPQSIPKTHPLNVSGVLNAVTYNAKYAGEITVVGKGAGGTETASSLLRDLIEIRRSITA